MTERAESESYWQADLSLGEIELEPVSPQTYSKALN